MMHPLLVDFSIFTWMNILNSEDSVISFLTEVQLIPSRDAEVFCSACNSKMVPWSYKSGKVGFRFVCKNRRKEARCNHIVDPLVNTFFEKTRIPFRDILAIVFCFVLKLPVTFCLNQISTWRRSRGERDIHPGTTCDWYSYCREVCEVIASHNYKELGGRGKTISVDETFLTVRKYHRGRVRESSKVVVLGIFCREDKEGLFFEVGGKKRKIYGLILNIFVIRKLV